MALEQLLASLTREAEAEAEAVLTQARGEAEAIRAEAERARQVRRDAVLAQRTADRESAVEQALEVARRTARREVLVARARVLERVFGRARQLFVAALQRSDYRAMVPEQVRDALACIGKRPATLRFHPALGQVIPEAATAGGEVERVEDDSVGAGFRLVSRDGTLEIDGTLEDRLSRLAPYVALEVVRELEDAGDAVG